MRIRKKPLGDKNLVGARIESIRRNRGMKQKELLAQLQVRGVDINASALSKLEGQLRTVTDIELLAFAEILDVDVFWLLTGKSQQIWATICMEPPIESDIWTVPETGREITWVYPMHALVLTGYDENGYYFSDPLAGQDIYYGKDSVEVAYTALFEQAIILTN